MSVLLKVALSDGTKKIVTSEEAIEMRAAGKLAEPIPDNKALTIEDVYGEDYGN